MPKVALQDLRPRAGALHPIPVSDTEQRRCLCPNRQAGALFLEIDKNSSFFEQKVAPGLAVNTSEKELDPALSLIAYVSSGATT
jgi:hypothetical protein